MKRTIFTLMVCLLCAAVLSGCKTKEKVFTIGVGINLPPFVYYDDSGHLTGIDVDIMEAIAKDQHFKISFDVNQFSISLDHLIDGKVDGFISSLVISEPRKHIYDFSDPYYSTGLVFSVRSKDETIKGLTDLKGKKVVALSGSLSEDYAESMKDLYNFTFVSLLSPNNTYDAVEHGFADCVIDDEGLALYRINKGVRVKIISYPVEVKDCAFAVRKGYNAELLEQFNKGLSHLKANGQLDAIIQKYILNKSNSTKKQ